MQERFSSKHRSTAVQRMISDVASQIESGELRPGDYIPSAREFAERYGIGYASVIRAYKTLGEAGLVQTVKGRGAFVCDQQRSVDIHTITICLPSPGIVTGAVNPHSDWVFQKLLAGISAATLARSMKLNLVFVQEAGDQWRSVVDDLGAGSGVIFVVDAVPAWVVRLQKHGIPYALLFPGAVTDWEAEIPHARADYYGSVYDMTSALLKKGIKRPAFLGELENGHEYPRYLGFAAALRDSSIERPTVIPCDAPGKDDGYAAMERYLRTRPQIDFDLLVAANDLCALGALDSLRNRGIKVPEQVSVVGFDDIASAADADLSTIHLPMRELGEAAVDWFLDTVVTDRGINPPKLVLPCRPVFRGTTV